MPALASRAGRRESQLFRLCPAPYRQSRLGRQMPHSASERLAPLHMSAVAERRRLSAADSGLGALTPVGTGNTHLRKASVPCRTTGFCPARRNDIPSNGLHSGRALCTRGGLCPPERRVSNKAKVFRRGVARAWDADETRRRVATWHRVGGPLWSSTPTARFALLGTAGQRHHGGGQKEMGSANL